jgi:hypothetical protein
MSGSSTKAPPQISISDQARRNVLVDVADPCHENSNTHKTMSPGQSPSGEIVPQLMTL